MKCSKYRGVYQISVNCDITPHGPARCSVLFSCTVNVSPS